MKIKLSHPVVNKVLAKHANLHKANSNEEPATPGYFKCLKGKDVITAKISDHHPIIHDGILFWNIMMQGKLRNIRMGISYNNGFGMIETDEDYLNRLKKVADVIAEVITVNPTIEAISLCEGPIQPLQVDTFLRSLKKHHSMDTFFVNSTAENSFYKPTKTDFPNWGLLMLADNKYKVSEIECDFIKKDDVIFQKLANRFQIWQLTNDKGENKYLGVGHFPFGGDERVMEKQDLSFYAKSYCDLISNVINQYSDKSFILCADFNLNPYLISEWNDRDMDKIADNNSILLTTETKSKKIDTVTVDGILLSAFEKQKYISSRFNFGLFSRLEKEDTIFQSNIKEYLIQNRHDNTDMQKTYDKQFSLILR